MKRQNGSNTNSKKSKELDLGRGSHPSGLKEISDFQTPNQKGARNINIMMPNRNSDDFLNQTTPSDQPISDQELIQELEAKIEKVANTIENEREEYDKAYNKTETVSLMTKYQMIFVKIEVYLMNIASIFQSKTFPDVKKSFGLIKRAAQEKKEKNARKAVLCVELVKFNLGRLKRIFRKKETNMLGAGFYRIKGIMVDTRLSENMMKLRKREIEKLMHELDEKKKDLQKSLEKIQGNNRALMQQSSNKRLNSAKSASDLLEGYSAGDSKALKKRVSY